MGGGRLVWELGGVPQMHRTDRLSAAVNKLGDRDLLWWVCVLGYVLLVAGLAGMT